MQLGLAAAERLHECAARAADNEQALVSAFDNCTVAVPFQVCTCSQVTELRLNPERQARSWAWQQLRGCNSMQQGLLTKSKLQ